MALEVSCQDPAISMSNLCLNLSESWLENSSLFLILFCEHISIIKFADKKIFDRSVSSSSFSDEDVNENWKEVGCLFTNIKKYCILDFWPYYFVENSTKLM